MWFSRWRKNMKKGISLYGKGEMTVKQPIFRSDLVDGVMASLHDPNALGQIYEAVGPQRLAQKIKIGNLNVFHGSSLDRLERDSVADESEGYPEIKELGVKLHSIEDKMPWEVEPFDLYAYYFFETPEEKPVVRKPNYISLDEERAIRAKKSRGLAALIPGSELIM